MRIASNATLKLEFVATGMKAYTNQRVIIGMARALYAERIDVRNFTCSIAEPADSLRLCREFSR